MDATALAMSRRIIAKLFSNSEYSACGNTRVCLLCFMKTELPVTELKAFVPAQDFELSQRFYSDLSFTLEWTGPDNALACFRIGNARFLLQKVGATFRPNYFMM